MDLIHQVTDLNFTNCLHVLGVDLAAVVQEDPGECQPSGDPEGLAHNLWLHRGDRCSGEPPGEQRHGIQDSQAQEAVTEGKPSGF